MHQPLVYCDDTYKQYTQQADVRTVKSYEADRTRDGVSEVQMEVGHTARPVNDLYLYLCVTSTPRCVFVPALRSRCALRDALQLSSFTRESSEGAGRGPKGMSCTVRSARALSPPPLPACRCPRDRGRLASRRARLAHPAVRMLSSVSFKQKPYRSLTAQRMARRQAPSTVCSMSRHGQLLITAKYCSLPTVSGRWRPGGGSRVGGVRGVLIRASRAGCDTLR